MFKTCLIVVRLKLEKLQLGERKKSASLTKILLRFIVVERSLSSSMFLKLETITRVCFGHNTSNKAYLVESKDHTRSCISI